MKNCKTCHFCRHDLPWKNQSYLRLDKDCKLFMYYHLEPRDLGYLVMWSQCNHAVAWSETLPCPEWKSRKLGSICTQGGC